jgi:phosphosulfolactate phosphohydrolase-like enzyme
MAKKTVRIDILPESTWRYTGYDAIVCVDVLLSATTIVTAVSQGRTVRVSDTARTAGDGVAAQEPLSLTDSLSSAGAGRFGGPAFLTANSKPQDVTLVTPFASMLVAASERGRVFVACLRNFEATANELALQHRRVVVIGAGEDGELCAADQMATAWLALRLQGRDFDLEGRHTVDEVTRWAPSDVSLIGLSRSAERLRSRGRDAEVAFVLRHVNDLTSVCAYDTGEVADPAVRRRAVEENTPTPAWGTKSVRRVVDSL